MNRKYILLVILVVIGALIVSAFSMVTINNQANLQRGREADAARYTAMARYYEAQNLSALSSDDVLAYRWQAMADFYTSQASTAVRYGPPR